ncbi:hypothetical protein [Glycomyces terrestris]|uniref:FtsK domain-containing protein n=1 Tax=Glycomyces terrestris TaxID=2493553 RepID=A0A426URL2_9ACTN|nr:hypothetical protein [Glycomyces terrestris]RRR95555.1 hypothetical protein EIW28_23895 [Glycomyces terrestris]
MGSNTNAKHVGHVVMQTGRGAVKATEFTVHHWRGLLPVLCIGAAMAFAGGSSLFAWLYGPWAWAWTSAIGIVLFIWADGWVGTLQRPARAPGVAFLLFTTAASVVLILAGAYIEAYMVVGVAGLVLGTWWWNGQAYQGHKAVKRAERRMETVLAKLGISAGTRITSARILPDGSREWRLYLGDEDRPDQIKAEDVAHMLKTNLDRVVVRRVEKGSSRSVKIVHLAKSPDQVAEKVHPALKAANRTAGAAWAPGTRSVLNGLPTGSVLGSAAEAVMKLYNASQDARCVMLLGKSGMGKTNTATAALLSLIACKDAVVGVCDIPKAGNLGLPFAPVLHRIARTADELEADLVGLYNLASDRCARLARGEVHTAEGKRARNWVPSPTSPAVVYFLDELANTMLAIGAKNADQAERIWDLLIGLGQFVRQAGIVLVPMSQTAKLQMIRPDFTSQMGTYVVHQLKKLADGGDIWQGLDVNYLEAGLPKVGMNLLGDLDGGDPIKTMSYDMDSQIADEAEWNRAVADYIGHRPSLHHVEVGTLGWGNALCGTDTAETAVAVAGQRPAALAPAAPLATDERGMDAAALLADAIEDDQMPAGAGIITGADPVDGDDERQAAVLAALVQAAAKGLSRADIERSASLSTSTAKRVLGALQTGQSPRVRREGSGRATRYYLADDQLVSA